MDELNTYSDSGELLTPGEVAKLFGVDPKTVTRWAGAGKLRALRTLGGHRRYRADEVHRLLTMQQGRAERDLPPISQGMRARPGTSISAGGRQSVASNANGGNYN